MKDSNNSGWSGILESGWSVGVCWNNSGWSGILESGWSVGSGGGRE